MTRRRIITITSDWGQQDFYLGMLQGRLNSLVPDANVIVNSQSAKSFRVLEGAFVVKGFMQEFPPGSIHLFFVNQGNRPDVYPVVIKSDDQYLIAWEDAPLGVIIDKEPQACKRIDPEGFQAIKKDAPIGNHPVVPSFPELSLFPALACAIHEAYDLEKIGPDRFDLIKESPWLPVVQQQTITGRVIYIDSYGNAVSNISKEFFSQVRQGRRFEIFLISNHYQIDQINTGYLETEPGELLALFNVLKLLEVAIVHGSIAGLLGLEPGSTIKVKFYD